MNERVISVFVHGILCGVTQVKLTGLFERSEIHLAPVGVGWNLRALPIFIETGSCLRSITVPMNRVLDFMRLAHGHGVSDHGERLLQRVYGNRKRGFPARIFIFIPDSVHDHVIVIFTAPDKKSRHLAILNRQRYG